MLAQGVLNDPCFTFSQSEPPKQIQELCGKPGDSAGRGERSGKREKTPMVEAPVTAPLPPDAVMMQLLFGKQITYSLAAMARLGVADHMDATPISVDSLAEKVDAHVPSLYRVMRMLASVGVFREMPGRQFAL